jgi:hypothetical protein
MLEQDEFLHERIKTVMLDVMAVLYDNGIKHVHMGAMMRLLGVDEVKASAHDNDMIELDENFGAMLSQLNKNTAPIEVPDGATFH